MRRGGEGGVRRGGGEGEGGREYLNNNGESFRGKFGRPQVVYWSVVMARAGVAG